MSDGTERRDTTRAAVQVEHLASAAILARAEEAITAAGERLLTERLHHVLDHDGSSGLVALATTLLPPLLDAIASLPHRITDELAPAGASAAQRLGMALLERNYPLNQLVPAAIAFNDHLLQDVGTSMRASDRPIVDMVRQLNRAMLTLGGDTLLAYHDQMTTSLTRLAYVDSLTGLSNRRYLDLRLDEELRRAQRTRRELALILLDVDGLKGLNDTFGHSAGDELLRVVAAILHSQARGVDVAARLGGDEFALLLPETGGDGAYTVLERLRQDSVERRIHDQSPRFSAGVAVYPRDGTTASGLMEHADAALYQAKHAPPNS